MWFVERSNYKLRSAGAYIYNINVFNLDQWAVVISQVLAASCFSGIH
jgi:hypothetical protein